MYDNKRQRSVDRALPKPNPRAGVTLVELVVVTAVMSMLTGLLAPAVVAARTSSRAAQCESNLHQVGLEIQNHLALHGTVPPRDAVGPVYDRCPGIVPPPQAGTNFSRYLRRFVGCRYPSILEEMQQPSQEIWVAIDPMPAEHNPQLLGLYLDGHVAEAVR
jgi:type II secretory pathway pseudopilin PulG